MALLFITHDLGVVAEIADDVAVMYLGNVVEQAEVDAIFNHPQHPYTSALLRSIPKIEAEQTALNPIAGGVPSPFERPDGCPFHPRCEFHINGLCNVIAPKTITIHPNHHSRCLKDDDEHRQRFLEQEERHV